MSECIVSSTNSLNLGADFPGGLMIACIIKIYSFPRDMDIDETMFKTVIYSMISQFKLHWIQNPKTLRDACEMKPQDSYFLSLKGFMEFFLSLSKMM